MPAYLKLAILQRLSLETGLLLNQATQCLTEMDEEDAREEAAREEAAREDRQKALQTENSADQTESAPIEALSALKTSAPAAHDLLQTEDESNSLRVPSSGSPAESLQDSPSRDSTFASGDGNAAETLVPGAKFHAST